MEFQINGGKLYKSPPNFKIMAVYVLDTSAIIERIATTLIKSNELSGTIIIPNAVVSELESQANKRREIGFIGLDELKELQEFHVCEAWLDMAF